jgi:hypothetical protein
MDLRHWRRLKRVPHPLAKVLDRLDVRGEQQLGVAMTAALSSGGGGENLP